MLLPPHAATFASVSEAAGPPAGFYEDGAGRRRWWDGSGWADRWKGALVMTEGPSMVFEAEQRAVLVRRLMLSATTHDRFALSRGTGDRISGA